MIGSSRRAGAWSLVPGTYPCGCRWSWFRRTLDGGLLPSGCPEHTITGAQWTSRVRQFHVKPEVTGHAAT